MPNIGIASLNVSLRAGRSVVTQQFGKAPLQVHRPLYLDDAEYPTVFLKTPSSGLLEGDQHQLTIKVERNASLEVRTQACTLVYPGASQQTIDVVLEDGASLMFEPHALILAEAAKFKQTITITLGIGCHLLFSESWCAGRIAMNERWRFASFENTVLIQESDKLVYREHWNLQPAHCTVEHPLICDGFTHFKNTYTTGSQLRDHGTGGLKQDRASRSDAEIAYLLGQPAGHRTWVLSKPGYSIKRTASKSVID